MLASVALAARGGCFPRGVIVGAPFESTHAGGKWVPVAAWGAWMSARSASPHLQALAESLQGSCGGALLSELAAVEESAMVFEAWGTEAEFAKWAAILGFWARKYFGD